MAKIKIENCVACGNWNKDLKAVEKIKYMTGDKKQLIEFINTQIRNRTIENYFKYNLEIVFAINYNPETENEWYTCEQLVSVGIMELK